MARTSTSRLSHSLGLAASALIFGLACGAGSLPTPTAASSTTPTVGQVSAPTSSTLPPTSLTATRPATLGPTVVAASTAPSTALATGSATAAQPCEFTFGFKALHDQIPDVVGDCVTNASAQPSGDVFQETTNGLLVWRKADNWTAFTDGKMTWVNGPLGLQSRANEDRFAWESPEPPPTQAGIGPEPAAPRPVALQIPDLVRGEENFTVDRTLNLPPGFEMRVFTAGLGAARMMVFGPNDDLYVSMPRINRVWVFPDRDHDGVADRTEVFVNGLDNPHGLAWHDGYLYIANEDGVIRARDDNHDLKADSIETVVSGFPTGGMHYTRTLGFGPDGKMYVSIGSSCDNCIEDNALNATIMRYNADGSGAETFVHGIRNAVGLAFEPGSGALWATVNGRDFLGDNLPPELLTPVHQGDDFGWPRCHAGRIQDPDFGFPGSCDGTVAPLVELPAHTAPLGLEFYNAQAFPAEYRGIFVALHGSWNSSVDVGNKVVLVRQGGDGVYRAYDFLTGWLESGRWGRPVDVITAPDGSLFVSDDTGGAIYQIRYVGG